MVSRNIVQARLLPRQQCFDLNLEGAAFLDRVTPVAGESAVHADCAIAAPGSGIAAPFESRGDGVISHPLSLNGMPPI